MRLLPTLNSKSSVSILPSFPIGDNIPKIIHQTYFDKTLPFEISENIDKIKSMNPGWEYRFYDDKDIVIFIKDNYPEKILYYFNRINSIYGAAKADLFRYLLIYKCGGIYLDIKATLEKPLDNILTEDDRYILSVWKEEIPHEFDGWGIYSDGHNKTFSEYQQWYIVASAGHPFLKAVIENVLRNIDSYNPSLHESGKLGVLKVTGPIAYTLAIAPILHLHKHRLVSSRSEMGFKYSIFHIRDAHNKLFKTHYANLTEPVINVNGFKKISVSFFKLLKNIKHSFS